MLKNQYDNALRYADYWVGRIRTTLADAGVLDRSVIAVIGDHGEGFMEHGLARHGVHTWEEMIHIPLIIWAGKDIKQTMPRLTPTRVRQTVSSIDLAPTIAATVGIEPHPSWQGVNMLDGLHSDQAKPVFSMTQYMRWQETVCFDQYKYIYDLTDVEDCLFDLQADPGETRNLVAERPELANAMYELLAGWHTYQLSYYAKPEHFTTYYAGRYGPDDDLLERLRVLTNR